MIYLPSEYINSSYSYYIDRDIYIVKNGEQCRNIFPLMDYISSDVYTCSDISLPTINFSKFTDSYFYRLDLSSIIFLLFSFILGLVLVFKSLFNALFRRFK